MSSLNLLDIYTDFKKKRINKSSFVKTILPIIEEHEDEWLRLQAIDLLTSLRLKDKQLFPFFEHLIISDGSEKIRNAALNYLSNNFLEKSVSLFRWAFDHEPSYNCQITLLQSFQKQDTIESRNLLIDIIKNMKKVKFLNQDKHYQNQKYRNVLKPLLKSERLKTYSNSLLAEIIINFCTIRHLRKLFPNVFFELNPENALVEQLDLSDYLEYEVKGTPWGWKNNITKLSDIKGLKYLTNLKKLDLSNNLISNLEEIIYLGNLSHLILTNNKISDIKNLSYLKQLPKLVYLDIDGNKIASKIKKEDFRSEIQLISDRSYIEIK